MTSAAVEPELLAKAQQGDRVALEAVLAQVAPAIHRFALRMCKSAPDAEDALQDALVLVARHLPEFEGRSALSSWAFSLARTACSRSRRGLKNRAHEPEELLAGQVDRGPSPEARAEERELGSALAQALDGLSEEQREVIWLRDVEGLTAPETADALGLSVEAVKSRLHRARDAMRESLRPVLEPRVKAAPSGCPQIAALWSQKLEGDLSQADCSTMEQHLLGCPSCEADCEALKKALLACQRARSQPVPAAVQERVKAALRAWAAGPRHSSAQ